MSNADDVEEVTNYLRAFRIVRQAALLNQGLADQRPSSVRGASSVTRRDARRRQAARRAPPLGEWIGGTRPDQARQKLDTTFPTANAAVKQLQDLGIVAEMTGQKTNRIYSYERYVELLMR